MSLVGERAPNKGRNEHGQTLLRRIQVCTFFAWVGLIMKFCKNLTGPCGAPSYLPAYLPLPTYLPTYSGLRALRKRRIKKPYQEISAKI